MTTPNNKRKSESRESDIKRMLENRDDNPPYISEPQLYLPDDEGKGLRRKVTEAEISLIKLRMQAKEIIKDEKETSVAMNTDSIQKRSVKRRAK